MQTVQGKEALPSPAPTPSPAWPCSRHRKDGTEEPTSCNGLLGFALVFLHLQRSETKREQRHTGSPAPTAGWKGRLGEPNVIAVSFPTSVTRGMEAFYSCRWGEKDHSTKNKQKKKKTTSLRNQDERPCHTGPGQKRTARGHLCHHSTEPRSPAAGDFTDP